MTFLQNMMLRIHFRISPDNEADCHFGSLDLSLNYGSVKIDENVSTNLPKGGLMGSWWLLWFIGAFNTVFVMSAIDLQI